MKHFSCILLLLLISTSSEICFSQELSSLDGFKYALIQNSIYEGNEINDIESKERLFNGLKDFGLTPLYSTDIFPVELTQNPCLAVRVSNNYFRGGNGEIPAYFSKLTFLDCRNKIVGIITKRHQRNYLGALNKTILKLTEFRYNFTETQTPLQEFATVENIKTTEEELLNYFDKSSLDEIEGVYKTGGYKIGIKKIGRVYKGITINSDYSQWKLGDVKLILEPSAVDGVFLTNYNLNNKKGVETIAKLSNGVLLELEPESGQKVSFLKMSNFKSSDVNDTVGSDSTIWVACASGFFINENGYIATNYHVVEKAKSIQVEYLLNGSKQVFSAKIEVVDKLNDLAIIRISSSKFQQLPRIPYVFTTAIRDVGSDVFTLGYPISDVLGEEIKFVDGKISSKTGLYGSITEYQITAPIQPGNSGGPLFDKEGNLIGITSGGLNRELFDSENVNYAIKSAYLKSLIDVLPQPIQLPNYTEIKGKSLTEKIKLLSQFIPIIRIK